MSDLPSAARRSGRMPDWLPAVEQFGEGFFLQFAPEALADWLSPPGLQSRASQLQAGAAAWIAARAGERHGGEREQLRANASGPNTSWRTVSRTR